MSEVLIELVKRYSPSQMELPAVRFLTEWMNAHGFNARIDEAGNAFGIRGDGDAAHILILLGHIDTVPGEITVRVEDGKLYGRGSVDAKGSLAAFADALLLLMQRPEPASQRAGASSWSELWKKKSPPAKALTTSANASTRISALSANPAAPTASHWATKGVCWWNTTFAVQFRTLLARNPLPERWERLSGSESVIGPIPKTRV